MFVDPPHKFPRASTLVCYLLNLVIEEGPYGDFDQILEHLPIFQTSSHPILIQCLAVLFIPPLLEVFCNPSLFSILYPFLINFQLKEIDNVLQFVTI